jgi:hypothetical protein
MFGSIDRKRLIKKGLACSKQRRKPTQKEWMRKLDTNPWLKASILGFFVLVLALLIFSILNQEPAKFFLIGFLVFLTAVAQLWINFPETFQKNSRVGLVFGTMLFHLCAAKLIMVFCSDPRGGLPPEFGVLVIPYALAPLVLCVLLGKNYGLYAAVFVSLWSSLLIRGVDAFLLVMSLISGFIAVFVTISVRRRSRLLRAGLYVGLATWIRDSLVAIEPIGLGPVWRTIGGGHFHQCYHRHGRRRRAAPHRDALSDHHGYVVD